MFNIKLYKSVPQTFQYTRSIMICNGSESFNFTFLLQLFQRKISYLKSNYFLPPPLPKILILLLPKLFLAPTLPEQHLAQITFYFHLFHKPISYANLMSNITIYRQKYLTLTQLAFYLHHFQRTIFYSTPTYFLPPPSLGNNILP